MRETERVDVPVEKKSQRRKLGIEYAVLGLVSAVSAFFLLTAVRATAPAAVPAPGTTTKAALAGDPVVSPSVQHHYTVVVAIEKGHDKVEAYELPDQGSERIATFQLEEGQSSFMAVENLAVLVDDWSGNTADGEWIEVFLPIRPNGSRGWIRLEGTSLSRNPYRITIDRSRFELEVFKEGEVIASATIAIGAGETPTPVGLFYTDRLYRVPDPDGPYGPFAFGLSGFSEEIFDFNGGPGIIGIHGTNDSSAFGSEVSHGCVRIPNELIVELASIIPLATPVEIT